MKNEKECGHFLLFDYQTTENPSRPLLLQFIFQRVKWSKLYEIVTVPIKSLNVLYMKKRRLKET